MKETIILYLVGAITKKQLIEASILYYDIDKKQAWEKHVEDVLKDHVFRENIDNVLANTRHEYKFSF